MQASRDGQLNYNQATGQNKMSNIQNNCAKCEDNKLRSVLSDTESFIYIPNEIYIESRMSIIIDVKKGYEIARKLKPEPTFAKDLRDVARLIAHIELCEAHVNHVPLSDPGLLVTFNFHKRTNGETERLFVIADGNHRASRCVRERQPFYFYYLDAEATKQISE